MDDLISKSQEELEKIRQNSVVGGDIYVKTTHLIEKIQQDTNNKQIAALINITKENSITSERNSISSKRLALAAITVSLIIGGVQIYLAYVQTTPIFQERAKMEKRNLAFCLQNTDSDLILQDDSTTTCKIFLRKNGQLLDQQINLFEIFSLGTTSSLLKNVTEK